MIDPLLLEQYNAGVERARDAYWHSTSPLAAEERAERKRERNRKYKESLRTRKKVERGRAA